MAGLYGMAERRPRGVTLYLLPGLAAAPRPRDAQLACHRRVPGAAPHTAHVPGPPDFAR